MMQLIDPKRFARETSQAHRVCKTCETLRPSVLFPKLPNRAYSKNCQLCIDTVLAVEDRVKRLNRQSEASKKAARGKADMKVKRAEGLL